MRWTRSRTDRKWRENCHVKCSQTPRHNRNHMLISSCIFQSWNFTFHLDYAHNSHHMLRFHFHKIALKHVKRPSVRMFERKKRLRCNTLMYEVICSREVNSNVLTVKREQKERETVRIVLILRSSGSSKLKNYTSSRNCFFYQARNVKMIMIEQVKEPRTRHECMNE